jgi:hypothetical protein
MAPALTHRSAAPTVRRIGFLSLVGWVAWVASRFEGRPFWSLTLRELTAIAVWAGGLHLVLRVVEALARRPGEESWRDYARAYGLMLFCEGTFLWYFNAYRVGPLDAQWYENVTTDFLTQARSGTFPVVLGSTVYAFNGAVHPFRSAPWQFVLADGVDLLSGRALAPVAVEHIIAIASFCAAVLILYVGFARSRPNARGWSWVFALVYAMSPAATLPLFRWDMYMTLTAQPVMVAAMLCAQRIVDDDSVAASGWLGVFLAALWYCHPPMALLTGMVAGALAAAALALRGMTLRRLSGAALGAATFVALATPYFRSMSELVQSGKDPLATLTMPALGLGLCLFAMGGFLRTRFLPWLALLPTGFLCLHEFAPSLVPFAGCFVGAMLVATWIARLQPLRYGAASLAVCALGASLAAIAFFHRLSIPVDIVSWNPADWRHFFVPIGPAGVVIQPGFLQWSLLAGMIVLIFASSSMYAQLSAAAGLVLVIAFGFSGELSEFLWRNTPADITSVIGVAYDLRLVPVVAVVGVTGGFYWFTALRTEHPGLGRILSLLILVLVPWTLGEHAMILYDIRRYKLSAEETANRNRSENVALERYSWDLLPPPRYVNWGVMDPSLETRFWGDGDHDKPMIDPDQIERALGRPASGRSRSRPRPSPRARTGSHWTRRSSSIPGSMSFSASTFWASIRWDF